MIESLATFAQQTTTVAPDIFAGDISLFHYLFVSAALFALGVIGFLTRRNMIVMFLCTEMMFQGVVVTLVAFSKFHHNLDGQVFVIFVLTIAAAEAAMALGLVVLLYRRKPTLDAESWSTMKG